MRCIKSIVLNLHPQALASKKWTPVSSATRRYSAGSCRDFSTQVGGVVPISSATGEVSTPSPTAGGDIIRILGVPPGPQQSIVWAFWTSRRMPRPMA